MKRVLVLGSGLVVPPLVRYLLKLRDVRVLVASNEPERAAAMIGGHARGAATRVDATNESALLPLVRESDLVVSLLPAPLHPRVARLCVAERVALVTTSYVSDAMRRLDRAAKDAGVLLLNEIGLDPGLDHMSACATIDRLKAAGASLRRFSSCCGGLPAPDADDNPWRYKFSWSPRGVLLAARNGASFRRDRKTVAVPAERLFERVYRVELGRLGAFEVYPNRDSIPYASLYGIEGAEGVFRGTYRRPGWAETLDALRRLGLLDDAELAWPPDCTWARMTTRQVPGSGASARARVARHLALPEAHPVLERLAWAGLLSDERLPRGHGAPIDFVTERLAARMAYAPGERDMVVLRHDFEAVFPRGRAQHAVATLVAYGEPRGDSAMARTVALPAAVASRLVLSGAYQGTGVVVPVAPELYRPVLHELDDLGIRLKESTETAVPLAGRHR